MLGSPPTTRATPLLPAAPRITSRAMARSARADFRSSSGSGPSYVSPATAAAYRALRSAAPMVEKDRVMQDDIQAAIALVADGTILRAAEDALDASAEE